MVNPDDLLAQLPVNQLAAKLGVSESQARSAVGQALPALLGGMAANAQDPAGAASLASAVGQHDARLVDGGIDLDQVDTADGEKIVHNVFGQQEDAVVQRLGSSGGVEPGLVAKVLPMLAPLVMSLLAKRAGGAGGGSGGGIGDLLGGLLGGGQAGGGQSGGLGGMLGSLLGGGGGQGGGGVQDLLGDLLGGGKR